MGSFSQRALMRQTLLLALLLACLGSAGCTALRKDRTELEAPSQPAGSAAVPIGKRHSVVIDEVTGTWNGASYEATPDTRRRFAEALRTSLVFERVYVRDVPESSPAGIGRVSIDASYDSDPHNVANFFRALLVGTIGYRIDIEGRLSVSIRLSPDREPITQEVTTRGTRIYYSAGRAGEARAVLLREVGAANQDLMRSRLRSDPRLIGRPG